VLTVEKEEIKVTTHGLLYRLNSVDVVLTTPRTQSQEKALENVEQFLEKLLEIAKTDRQLAIHSCQSYLSACTSDHFRSVPVDEKFLKLIVECAVDDQKKIKKKLENLFSSLTKLENS
jgi:BCL2-associated athanogene 2